VVRGRGIVAARGIIGSLCHYLWPGNPLPTFIQKTEFASGIHPSYFVTQNEEPNSQFRTRHPFYADDDTFRHSGEVMLRARSIRHKLL